MCMGHGGVSWLGVPDHQSLSLLKEERLQRWTRGLSPGLPSRFPEQLRGPLADFSSKFPLNTLIIMLLLQAPG